MHRSIVACVLGGTLLVGAAGPALAHGSRESGPLTFTVGWAEEPTLVGFTNAVELILSRDGAPVEGAVETLTVVVSVGDESTSPLALSPVFDAPGRYHADLIPTVPGDYTFRFTGTVDDQEVDESFTASEDGFDEVHTAAGIAFPREAPSTTELADRLDAVEETAKRAGGIDPLAMVALVVAVVALGVTARRRSSA